MIITGDSLEKLKELEDGIVQTCITSPPYWGLRDYGVEGQLGLETTPEEYVANLVKVFREVKRVLKKDGTLWLNLGDSYAGGLQGAQGKTGQRKGRAFTAARILNKLSPGLKRKDLVGIPWRVAFALQADGWYLRQDIIWHKPNPMPESVKDRCTKSHEYIFLLSKKEKYLFNIDTIREPANFPNGPGNKDTGKYSDPKMFRRHGNLDKIGPSNTRQKRSVWSVATKPFKGAHFATFPLAIIEPCVLAGSKEGDMILDPFFGAGTVGLAAQKHKRKFIGIELNPEYIEIAEKRLEA